MGLYILEILVDVNNEDDDKRLTSFWVSLKFKYRTMAALLKKY